MSEAWFAPEAAQYFPLVSVLSLTALAAPLIARGKHRGAILTIWGAIVAFGMALLATGAFALIDHQPYHVAAPLLITGLAIASAYSFSAFFVLRSYRMAEQRKVAAREL